MIEHCGMSPNLLTMNNDGLNKTEVQYSESPLYQNLTMPDEPEPGQDDALQIWDRINALKQQQLKYDKKRNEFENLYENVDCNQHQEPV